MTELEKWKNDFKEFISELSIPRDDYKGIMAYINEVPTVTPKEKTAAWVPTDEEPHEIYECNACGWLLYDIDRTDFKYCPNCGARMVSE